jgi:hypothetical protein
MKQKLVAPYKPVYPQLTKRQQDICDEYAETLASEPDWSLRSLMLRQILSGTIMGMSATERPHRTQWTTIVVMTTAILESLGEHSIETASAAHFYALSAHQQWRNVAKAFLDADPGSGVAALDNLACFIKMLRGIAAEAVHG